LQQNGRSDFTSLECLDFKDESWRVVAPDIACYPTQMGDRSIHTIDEQKIDARLGAGPQLRGRPPAASARGLVFTQLRFGIY